MIWYDLYDILTMDQSLKNISISKKIIKLSFSLSKKTHLLWDNGLIFNWKIFNVNLKKLKIIKTYRNWLRWNFILSSSIK